MENAVKHVDHFKFLGCIIDSKLTWSMHIASVCKKISCGIGILRTVRISFPIRMLEMIYFAYIYPYIMYCLAIWGNAAHIHTNKALILQKRTLRIVYKVLYCEHVKPLAHAHNLLLLPELYEYCLSLFLYRCLVLCYNPDLFVKNGFIRLNTLCNTRNSGHNFFIPYARLSLRKHCIIFECVKIWNLFPVNVKQLSSLGSFKSHHKSILLAKYCN